MSDRDKIKDGLRDAQARVSRDVFAQELRKWWSFDNGQQHTHSWHSREDFIEKRLPALLSAERERCAQIALAIDSGRGNEKEIARAIRELT
jgi:hypothetical protein